MANMAVIRDEFKGEFQADKAFLVMKGFRKIGLLILPVIIALDCLEIHVTTTICVGEQDAIMLHCN